MAYKKLLFSFIYASIYSVTPFFLLIISMMFIGGSVDITDLLKATQSVTGNENQQIALGICVFIVGFISLIVFFKHLKAYLHILHESLTISPWKETLIAIVFFIFQVLYTWSVLSF
ncbi:hypothetical protein [Riemerella columbina]|uniref:hypothetical protein n=1 Tax=Riemerella columbina TaxID=103810 RepID=UPI002670A169|nr:hypothetical protein [Riemerella columbina]WKS95766.1 hypothetical protein NYR17_03235 [Riemerella columbina]